MGRNDCRRSLSYDPLVRNCLAMSCPTLPRGRCEWLTEGQWSIPSWARQVPACGNLGGTLHRRQPTHRARRTPSPYHGGGIGSTRRTTAQSIADLAPSRVASVYDVRLHRDSCPWNDDLQSLQSHEL